MKALVPGFHMLYRLSQDSKYPWPSGTTEQTRVQFLGGSNSWAALFTRTSLCPAQLQARLQLTSNEQRGGTDRSVARPLRARASIPGAKQALAER